MRVVRNFADLAGPPTFIVVGTNGKPRALVAVEAAAKLASQADASLLVVVAYEPMSAAERARFSYQLGPLAYQLAGSHPAEANARDAVAHAAMFDVSAGYEAVRGRPVEVLRRIAKERGADLIVLPEPTHRGLGGLLRPDVPTCLIRQAPCDVLLVGCRGVEPTPLFPSRKQEAPARDVRPRRATANGLHVGGPRHALQIDRGRQNRFSTWSPSPDRRQTRSEPPTTNRHE